MALDASHRGSTADPVRVDPTGTTAQPVSGTVAVAGTVPVSAASLPLPTGAATSAELQADIGVPTDTAATGDGSLIAVAKQLRVLMNTGALTVASGQVSGLGNNTLITPTSGTALRIYYASYNPLLAVEAAFRFGAAGTLWLRNNVNANSVIAKDYGDFRYIQGAVDALLILNLSIAVSVNWNVFYKEV